MFINHSNNFKILLYELLNNVELFSFRMTKDK